MQLQALRSAIYQALTRLLIALERSVKQCLQPVKPHLIGGALADITRSKSELIAENAFLRQQLIVLQRQTKRPVFTSRDRTLLVLLASRFRWWREALIIVKPDTLLGWHRQGFRLFWRHRSKARRPQPRVPEHVIALIHSMALDNRLWGSKRIRDELRKLG
ncbi:MAG: helix-turn-helix domain-containing protein [Chloroflexi bacterium]|nr:helix-turn-helix domain-containing protein [Chloroflexota bacterium]